MTLRETKKIPNVVKIWTQRSIGSGREISNCFKCYYDMAYKLKKMSGIQILTILMVLAYHTLISLFL